MKIRGRDRRDSSARRRQDGGRGGQKSQDGEEVGERREGVKQEENLFYLS